MKFGIYYNGKYKTTAVDEFDMKQYILGETNTTLERAMRNGWEVRPIKPDITDDNIDESDRDASYREAAFERSRDDRVCA